MNMIVNRTLKLLEFKVKKICYSIYEHLNNIQFNVNEMQLCKNHTDRHNTLIMYVPMNLHA